MPNGGRIFPAILLGLDSFLCAAPTELGMIFEDWISTNRSPLWDWGQIARFRKISITPPRPSPSMGLMEREKEAVDSIRF